MKKITYLVLVLFFSFGKNVYADVVSISVGNFAFNPSIVTANIGDTIMWIWNNGSHNTTSTSIPAGAIPWTQPLNSASPMFMYQISVAGEYDYVCTFHASMGMTGHITVLGSSGISNTLSDQAKIINTIVQSDIEFQFNDVKHLDIELMSLTGSIVKQFSVSADAGRRERFSLADLPNGIYIVRMTDGRFVQSKRIIKQ